MSRINRLFDAAYVLIGAAVADAEAIGVIAPGRLIPDQLRLAASPAALAYLAKWPENRGSDERVRQ